MDEKKSISRYPIAGSHSLPPEIQSQINEVKEKTGFIPNVFLALAHRPKELNAFIQYHEAIMELSLIHI